MFYEGPLIMESCTFSLEKTQLIQVNNPASDLLIDSRSIRALGDLIPSVLST